MLGAYSAVPPPASIQKAPAAPAAAKAKASESSDSSDDSSDEEKKVPGERIRKLGNYHVSIYDRMSNSVGIVVAKPAPVKKTVAKPAAKKQESSSDSSGNDPESKSLILFPN